MEKEKIVASLTGTGMIPVFYHADIEICKGVVKASYDAGVKVFEFTNRGSNAFEVFVALKKYIVSDLPDMLIGVGSILDGATTEKFIQAGADFIVSPIFKPEMGLACAKTRTPWFPGCMTLTEIVNAFEAGADVVKIFPGASLGPKFVAAVLAPIPWLKLMPTGGVEPNEQNLSEWFKSGVVCVGLGGQLFKKDLLEKKDFEGIKNDIAAAYGLVKQVRQK